ncbi:CYTH domain-containing protein [Chitinophagaceae bacterium MMS25-I14]
MATEIERKYLVNHEAWHRLNKPEPLILRQGYIVTDPQKTIRVRISDTKGFITIKGINTGATRAEYEYEIPLKDATELLNGFAVSEINKKRYEIMHEGHLWEVDVFAGDNEGLIVAEIELQSETEQYPLPEWIAAEVTGDNLYYNSNLSLNPYKNWR